MGWANMGVEGSGWLGMFTEVGWGLIGGESCVLGWEVKVEGVVKEEGLEELGGAECCLGWEVCLGLEAGEVGGPGVKSAAGIGLG